MINYSKVNSSDYNILTDIMTKSFNEDTKIHTNFSEDGPTGYNDGTLIKKLAISSKYITRKVTYNNKVIGAFSISNESDDTFCLEILFIDPEYNNMDLGTIVWNYIESTYTRAKKWILETPSYSKRNHHFYSHKCGFIFAHKKSYSNKSESFVFEKTIT